MRSASRCDQRHVEMVRQPLWWVDQRFVNFPTTTLLTETFRASPVSTDYLERVQTGRLVLVVDDDEGVRTAVTWALEADGFDVLAVENGLAVMDVMSSFPVCLMVLDLSLPGLGGLDILSRLRAAETREGRWRLPVIVLSGRDSEMDRIVGLDLGADDYLVKPFSPGELAARARSLLRRSAEPDEMHTYQPTGSGVEIDTEARNVWVEGIPIELAAKEFDLLAYFLRHPRRAYRRSELLAAVWSSESGWQNESTVTEHVYRLRGKIETNPQHPRWLVTVRAVGYRWEG